MTITLKPGEEFIIPTIQGIVKIKRGDTDARKMFIELPDGVMGSKGGKDLKCPLFDYKAGKMKPKFHLLVPRIADGDMVGVDEPKVLRVG